MPPTVLHYVTSSHWDREWYWHFQEYRHRLIALLDLVLDALEDGRLPGPFTCDGQAIILEDYLEIRPQARERVQRHLRAGNLVAGPWYVLPDEFLVSGESLVRNIRRGRDVVRALGGEPSAAGFACDLFGHVSQLPQILAGFGVEGALVWRGINHPGAFLVWEGADGTELFSYRFGRVGYCTFTDEARTARRPLLDFDPETFQKGLRAHVDSESARTPGSHVLLFDGGDHIVPSPEVYAGLQEFAAADPSVELRFSSLDVFLREAAAQGLPNLPRWRGEMREPGKHPAEENEGWLIPGVLSSRPWIKQRNAACETLLGAWAEPFNAFARAALGTRDDAPFLVHAWDRLLQNHPHDSICGCSIDAVHEDMKYRFAQAERIGERVAAEALAALAVAAAGEPVDGEAPVVLFNASQEEFRGVAELDVVLPPDWPHFNEFFGFEPKPSFRLFDAHGDEVEYQRVAQRMGELRQLPADDRFTDCDRVNRVRVAARVCVPGLGMAVLRARRQPWHGAAKFTRAPLAPTIARGGPCLDNDILRLEALPGGPLRLTDKRNGAQYALPILQDHADIGDGWYHGQAVAEEFHDSRSSAAHVSVPADGPLLARLRLRLEMSLPAEFDFQAMRRSPACVLVPVEAVFTLREGAEFLDVEVVVDNRAKDHRLRLLLPTGARDATAFIADSAFDVVERPIALPADGHTYKELPVETQPMESWAACFDGHRGLAVIAPGQKEVAVLDDEERTLALTLLRATRRTVMTEGEPEGQVQGENRFRLRLVPLAGAPDVHDLYLHAQQVAAGLRCVTPSPAEHRRHRPHAGREIPSALLQVDGPVVLTACHQEGDGLLVRLFNPTGEPVEAELRAAFGSALQPTNLEGAPNGDAIALDGGAARIPFGRKQIRTLRVLP